MPPSRHVYAWEIIGKGLADQRSVSMTLTTPPTTYRWTSETIEPNLVDEEVWKTLRLVFLEKYTLEVSETSEDGYRYWRWLDGETTSPHGHLAQDGRQRLVVWWERRKWTAKQPTTPGLWPS